MSFYEMTMRTEIQHMGFARKERHSFPSGDSNGQLGRKGGFTSKIFTA
jgi:hypothetical protein